MAKKFKPVLSDLKSENLSTKSEAVHTKSASKSHEEKAENSSKKSNNYLEKHDGPERFQDIFNATDGSKNSNEVFNESQGYKKSEKSTKSESGDFNKSKTSNSKSEPGFEQNGLQLFGANISDQHSNKSDQKLTKQQNSLGIFSRPTISGSQGSKC